MRRINILAYVKTMAKNNKLFEFGFTSEQHLNALINAHVHWITQYLDAGWDRYSSLSCSIIWPD